MIKDSLPIWQLNPKASMKNEYAYIPAIILACEIKKCLLMDTREQIITNIRSIDIKSTQKKILNPNIDTQNTGHYEIPNNRKKRRV